MEKHPLTNRWKPARVEWVTFFVIMPFLNTIIVALLYGKRAFEPGVLIPAFLVIGTITFISWYMHVCGMHWLRTKLPELRQTLLRALLLSAFHVTLITCTMAVYFYGADTVHFLGYIFNEGQFHKSIFVGISLTMIATTLWEGEYIIAMWKKSLAEKEKFEQLTIENEFDTLKSQVNPHFLFNCFNTLSSLISEDPDKAEQFLNELSKVYRYLLNNNEHGMSTLRQELKFIESYFRLLKTRHGDAIDIQFEVDKKYDNYLLPTLSLQLLVENAVKHNIVSRQAPLTIEIFTLMGNKLAINNNLQPRLIKAPSNKIGLDNIRAKYELLKQPGFMIMDDSRNFTVVLPLIWDKAGITGIPVSKTNIIN